MKPSKTFICLLSILLIGALVMMAGCGETTPDTKDAPETEDVKETEDIEDAEDTEDAVDNDIEEGSQVYTGEAEGGHGPVIVEVTMDDGKIVSIEVIEENETKGLGDAAFEELIPKIIEAQSTEGIDTVSGATVSSNALFEAVDEAVAKSK
ncbi:FMN-binding protein [Candidatus Contubernalis alkaliaceticus]|uniref:FMN-binding protein n=1 Tax=Candidatus Contubernalis alkaliaceticus TaxID=338645 RepID=UPI001F4C4A51|nr:FMN-binding protein [Candidatus Contubernalis alkalaceticus]UNC91611.1 FMN-binding protein [Candidatus Contubernalis alkalaceticus]